MQKVKLPRDTASRLDEAIKIHGGKLYPFLKDITNELRISEPWRTLRKFASEKQENLVAIIDAFLNGYELMPEPITVTITPEMQESLKWYVSELRTAGENWRIVESTLNIIGAKVFEING